METDGLFLSRSARFPSAEAEGTGLVLISPRDSGRDLIFVPHRRTASPVAPDSLVETVGQGIGVRAPAANLASRGGGLVLLHRSAVHRADSWSRRPKPCQQGPSTDAETPLLAQHVCDLRSSEPDPVFALAALLNLLCSVRVRTHEMSPIFDHQEFDVSFAARPGLGSPYGGFAEAGSTNFWPQSRQR